MVCKWNNSQILGPAVHRGPCVIGVFGYMAPAMLERAVQTDPTLLRYTSAITEQKKCWESLGLKFGRFQTLLNNSQQNATICSRVCKWAQHVISNNVASVCRGLKCKEDKTCRKEWRNPLLIMRLARILSCCVFQSISFSLLLISFFFRIWMFTISFFIFLFCVCFSSVRFFCPGNGRAAQASPYISIL